MNVHESDRPIKRSPLVSVEALERLTEEKRMEMSEEGEEFWGKILGVPVLAFSLYYILTHLDQVAPTIEGFSKTFQR